MTSLLPNREAAVQLLHLHFFADQSVA